MSRVHHLGRCKEETEKRDALIAEWIEKWPNYCKSCHGEGLFTERFDPSYGVGSLGIGTYEDENPCPYCTEEAKCARCGFSGLLEKGLGPCPNCGWNYDDALPPAFECFCWEIEQQEWEKLNRTIMGLE